MKITKINGSFAMKKSLGQYEMADIFFAAEAEVGSKDKPEDVAEKVHEFCKKLAVAKWNKLTRKEIETSVGVVNEIDYEKGFRAGYKKGVDPNEGREVMSEQQMDNKSEDPK